MIATLVTNRRATRIADAALEILGTQGARGLTHRAVDQQAGLPRGSTSNLFRTRAALLSAAHERLVAIDVARLTAVAEGVTTVDVSPDAAAALLAGVVERWTHDDDVQTLARLELILESRRQRDFAQRLAHARGAFHELIEGFLARIGCRNPAGHAVPIMVLVDGLVANQLLQPATRLSSDDIRETLERWLAAC